MDKIFEITAKEVTVQVKDERTGVVYSRTLPIDYYENANVLKLSGEAASWGNILQASKQVVQKAAWTVIFPGGAVILCVLSLSLLGDGLRDYLDPRTAGRRRK